jgi:hypothetical protein
MTQFGIFGLKIYHLATLLETSQNFCRHGNRSEIKCLQKSIFVVVEKKFLASRPEHRLKSKKRTRTKQKIIDGKKYVNKALPENGINLLIILSQGQQIHQNKFPCHFYSNCPGSNATYKALYGQKLKIHELSFFSYLI